MVLWTIFILPTDDSEIKEIQIDSNQTFGEFRSKAASAVNINSNDLLIAGKEEYNASYNSKKMCEVNGIYDQCTLFAVYQVGAGK
jgi:hypothetical protein